MPFNDKLVGVDNAFYAISDNPVFKVKLKSLSTGLEQSNNPDNKKSKNPNFVIKIGDIVSGKDIDSDKIYKGKVVAVSNSSVTIIEHNKEDKITLDKSSIQKLRKFQSDPNKTYWAFEGLIMSYKDFVRLNEEMNE